MYCIFALHKPLRPHTSENHAYHNSLLFADVISPYMIISMHV